MYYNAIHESVLFVSKIHTLHATSHYVAYVIHVSGETASAFCWFMGRTMAECFLSLKTLCGYAVSSRTFG